MSKKSKAKGRGRGVPVDMEYDLEDDGGSGAYVLPTGSSYRASEIVLSSRPTSKKERQKEAEAAAAAVIAAKAAEAAKQEESDRLYKEYMEIHKPPKPPKSVTCALCKSAKPAGAVGWKPHPFGFANQGICAACDAETVPFTASSKLVWEREPNMLSARQARLQELLYHASAPPNALKAQIAETAAFDLTPKQRMDSFHGMHKKLSAAFLTPPVAGMEPLTKAQLAKFTDATYKRNRGGTRRAKSKSKSKSKRSKSRSRSRAHR